MNQRITYPIKLLKNLALFLARNANAMIDDFQLHGAVLTV
jgi:hypothetical protein